MSLMFKPPAKDNLDPKLVQVMLEENALLIKIVAEYQNKGKVHECLKYQEILTRNLLYLSVVSDFQADEKFSPFSKTNENSDDNQ